MTISLDLQRVLGAAAPLITSQDLEAMITSEYCFRDVWISQYVATRRHWLTDDALDWLITQGEQALASTIGEFPERAERYAELAVLAASHGRLMRAENLLNEAAENLLAHRPHKDLLLGHVLDAIEAHQSEAPINERRPDDHAVNWVQRLAPPIANITEFTDGDETDHLPKWLANTMAEVAPDLLPVYYQWLAETEQYGNAEHTLGEFVRVADLTDPVVLAVTQTATDDTSLEELARRARYQDPQAREALIAMTAIMGQSVAVERPTGMSASQQDHLIERPKLPPPDLYPPEKFSDFLTALRASGYWSHGEAITVWAEFWSARGRGLEAHNVLVDAFERRHTSSACDGIYRLAAQYRGREDAYDWLIRAYRELNGWNKFVASEPQASKYWEVVKAHYSTRWADFLGDTILGDIALRGPTLGSGSFKRLVSYCMMMGQRQLAGQLVEEMVKRSLELVSALQFPTPGWVFRVQGNR
jgi:hypothetical protein